GGTVSVDRNKKIARKSDYLDHLDLDRTYTLEEFEIIKRSAQKSHFKLDKSGDRSYVANTNFQGNCCIEKRRTTPSVIGTSRLDRTIACLPRRWFYTRNKRDSSSKCCLNAKNIYRNLTQEQGSSVRGQNA
ncbi:13206_t:CDS:2, partial [Funneliformis mosseae]